MNVSKLNEAVDAMKKSLGDSLLATNVWRKDEGMPIAGHNDQPAACALFNQVTEDIIKTLQGSGFPSLKNYYLLELEDDNLVVILELIDYQWGILVDSKKVKLGILLSIVIPKARLAFIDALES